jgi:hypothetical protein
VLESLLCLSRRTCAPKGYLRFVSDPGTTALSASNGIDLGNKETPFLESLPVGARGFEPPTSCTPCKRASRAAPRPDIQTVSYSVFSSQPSISTLALQAPRASRAAPRPDIQTVSYSLFSSQPSISTLALQAPRASRAAPRSDDRLCRLVSHRAIGVTRKHYSRV